MLEDFTMEKKSSSRSGQPPVKGNGTESKKNPDTVGSKIFPKTSRRREPVSSQNAKYETNRKPVPQKNKSFDKRPKPRGQYYGCGKEDSKVAEGEVECGGIYVKKQIKKLNLNHLLNFHYASRDSVNSGQRNWRANPGGWGRYASKSLKHKYNKEQFLQANCQFVVKADGDYSSYMMNPDMLVDWELIEQIQLRSAEVLSCPICLYPPVAAKMTRCGHVFCWSCILHYLALSDKSWRKCPICYETVIKNDLKSVIAVPHTSFSVGDIITLHLMKRKRGSLIALPVNQSEICPADKLLSVSEKQVDTKYSKLLLASSQEVFSIIDKEMQELTAQLEEVKGCPEACFVEQALELLKERAAICRGEQVLFQQNDPVLSASEMSAGDSEMFPMCEPLEDGNNVALDASCENVGHFVNHPLVNDINQNFTDKYDDIGTINHQRYESVSSEGVESEDGAITVEDIELPNTDQMASAIEGSSPKDFYFYQAADGQHVYLHALNIRMLVHFYGGLKNCPLILTGQIVEKETGSMTEELRQRLRYLQHLPITCQFEVVELQLRPPIVNRETIDYFQDQLEIRKRRRLRRARDERRREKRINEQENKHWGRFPAPHISIDSHFQFPSCGVEVENVGSNIPAPTPSSSGSSPAHSYDAFSSVSSALENVSIDENPLPEFSTSPEIKNSGASSGPSFAQMLRSGKSKWPSVSEKKKHKEQHILGQKQYASPDSDPEYEGYTPLKQSFGDAIAEAMERAAAMAAASTSAKDEMQDDPGSSGKKKKKQKQKLLFATGMACISK